MTASELIKHLGLQPHPEGGYYKETYRSGETLILADDRERNFNTAIYYLLENEDRSAFHRIKSDELWFFHQGQPLEILILRDVKLNSIVLGNNTSGGEIPQAMIPANTWFAARVKNSSGFALVSCTVAPGFDFADFELAKKGDLLGQYPHLSEVLSPFLK